MNKEEQESRAKLNRYNFQEGKLAGKQEILRKLRKLISHYAFETKVHAPKLYALIELLIEENSSPSEGGE